MRGQLIGNCAGAVSFAMVLLVYPVLFHMARQRSVASERQLVPMTTRVA